jgi:segregation and condensation protein A
LAEVIDAFLVEVERLDRVDLDVATEFLLIASTLVELKARRLLPGADMTELDEELLRFEERDLLLARLLACRTFRSVARLLEQRLEANAGVVARALGPDERFTDRSTPDLLAGVSPADLRAAYLRATAVPPRPVVDLAHVTPIRASVADAVSEVAGAVHRAGRVTFRGLVAGLVERVEVVVRFLAVLELVKQGVVEVDQGATFATLIVSWVAEGVHAAEVADLVAVDAYEG